MSEDLIAPGKRLAKPLLHPTTGNVLLPAGTVLTGPYIDRLNRQGMLPHLKECIEGFDEDLHGLAESTRRDLDSFEIDIPDLPAILFEYTAAINASLPKPEPAPREPVAPAAEVPPSPEGASTPAAAPLPASPPPAPGPLPSPPLAPAPGATGPASGAPSSPPRPPSGAPVAPPSYVPQARYHHNPQHALSERGLMTAMLAVDNVDQQLRGGQLPSYPALGSAVQDVIARLSASQGSLSDGLELRVVNQPHHKSHPVNVMTLSIAMGLALGYDTKQLFTLGITALCHDIGKAAIPAEVLVKAGALAPGEIDLLRAHPLLGRRIMEKLTWATPEMARIVHEHHERLNGSGYPQRLKGEQIHEMARIIAVAEVYDALASDTGYRPRYTPEFAYVTVRNGERMGLDPNVLKAFAKYVFPYPLQAFVILTDGRTAQVTHNNRLDPLRPIVRIKDATINLMDAPELTIKDLHIQAF